MACAIMASVGLGTLAANSNEKGAASVAIGTCNRTSREADTTHATSANDSTLYQLNSLLLKGGALELMSKKTHRFG